MITTDESVPTATSSEVAVWDLPVRITHWALAALVFWSWGTAKWHHEQWHIWSGYAILFLLLFRLFWGVAGSTTARFTSFVRGPGGVLAYIRNARGWHAIGHTPLGALSVVALLGLMIAQIGFGLILVDDDGVCGGPLSNMVDSQTSELAMGIHAQLFNLLLGFIALHLAAIVYYRLARHKKLVRAMITGRSEAPAGTIANVPAGVGRLVLCLAFAAAISGWIIAQGSGCTA
ncbi:cytochrome b/b6 domain-containing protein [Sphingomonas ginkgonis]|nr:cytochrome b/b6 domain-containing protein [Sphingomonas ginkgonis]